MATLLLFCAGCATRYPLEGWRRCRDQGLSLSRLDKAITDDYWSYIERLPREEREYVIESNIWLLEDGTGRLAIQISIPLRGFWTDIWWNHILIYDTNNKRIKTMKHKGGRSLS